ncbi:MAG: hypothetical protein HYW85_03770 [Deltaproteobacteria bacterium]|nr:hypothetical protein [Deltaproteobacteria bacterium]
MEWGQDGYGFSALDRCVQSVQSSSFGLVCNWSGSYYAVYDSYSNRTISEGFRTLEDCSHSIHP